MNEQETKHRPIIMETDIGRDPDDFFALLYFISAGVDIKLITVSPGDPDQIAVVKFICRETGLDCPVGVGKLDRGKRSCSGFHTDLLSRFNFELTAEHDGWGPDLINQVYGRNVDLFVCGPLTSVGKWWRMWPCQVRQRATMQGGFLPYSAHEHRVTRLEKFEGKSEVPTFNLNGDRKGADAFIKAPLKDRRFVSKNVCHTIVYDGEMHEQVLEHPADKPGQELFRIGMEAYLAKHPDGKKFHDPTAAVCHLHPEICTWVKGQPYRKGGKWGWDTSSGEDHISAKVDEQKLIELLATGV